MTSPPDSNRAGMPRRRKLNQSAIKSAIVLVASGLAALGSAVSGIGAHLGFAPMLSWMFGYNQEKAQGTALRLTLVASLTAVLSYCAFQQHAGAAHRSDLLGYMLSETLRHASVHAGRGILLVIGATFGALLAAPITPKATAIGARRALQAIAIVAAVFTVTEASHLSEITRASAHYAHLTAWWQLILLGLGVGAATQAARLAGGALLVPALYFLTALPDAAAVTGFRPLTAADAVIESLIVVLFASLLPAWGYSQKNLVDRTYLFPAILGGVVGGMFGGWLDTLLLERTILIFFSVVAMFFAAREIARLAGEQPVPSIRGSQAEEPPSDTDV